MKRFCLFLAAMSLFSAALSGQDKVIPNKPYSSLNSGPGYITSLELTKGFGLGDISVPYSKSYTGINTLHGFQVNRFFVIGGGTGILFYNGGTLFPLFVDIKYRMRMRLLTPYIYGDGGILMGTGGESKMFINPGAGVRYSFNQNLGLTLSTGLWAQVGETKDTFINVRLGVVFKPK